MSLILDALRRRAGRDAASEGESDARADNVLATLGYPRGSDRQGLTVKRLLVYGTAAVALGFLGVGVPVCLMGRRPPVPSVASVRVPVQRPAPLPLAGSSAPSALPAVLPVGSGLPPMASPKPAPPPSISTEPPSPTTAPPPVLPPRPAAPVAPPSTATSSFRPPSAVPAPRFDSSCGVSARAESAGIGASREAVSAASGGIDLAAADRSFRARAVLPSRWRLQ